MAKYLTNIELEGNQLINALVHPAGTAPTGLGDGQMYYNTASDDLWVRSAGTFLKLAFNSDLTSHTGDSSIHFTVGSIDHGSIAGLGDDDHSQYLLLLGRSGGQTIIGGTAASNNLVFQTTSNVTKGSYIFSETPTDADAADDILLRDTTTGALHKLGIGTGLSITSGNLNATGVTSNSFETHTITDTDSGFTWAGTGSAVADSATDTLTWVSGTDINVDVDAASDAIRISFSNATGYTTNTGTVTSVGTGTGLSGGAITTTGTISLSLNSLAEKTGNLVGTDRLVGVSGTTHFSETISAIPLSIFNNDSGWTSNTGTVTAVNNGNGMNFTNITGSGTVTLGTPSTLTSATANAVTASSHTHALDISGFASTSLSDTGNIGYLNGTETVSGTWTFSNNVTLNGTPSASTDAVTKGYVDSVAQGLDAKDSVVAATTANITLSGTQTIDGVSVLAGERVLVKNQTTTSQNGIYTCAAGAWSRAADMDSWAEHISAFVFVEEGTSNGDTGWVCTVDSGGTLGTTAVTFSQFSGAGSYTAGNGLTLTGTSFALGTPGSLTGSTTNNVTASSHTHAITTGITSGSILESSGGTNGHVAYFNATGIASEANLSASRGGTGVGTFGGTNTILYTSAADTLGSITTANNGLLVTGGTGIPSISTTIPSAVKSLAGNQASTTASGFAEIATQTEVNTGTDAVRYITPATLSGYGTSRSSSGTIGNGVATSIAYTHNLGTRSVIVQVFTTASPYDTVYCDVTRNTTNQVTLDFAAAPATNEFTVVVTG